MKPSKPQKIIFQISVFWVLVIFTNSLLPGDLSSSQSGFVTNLVAGFFSIFGVTFEGEVLSSVIRSLAHFTEFMILGILWMTYIQGFHKDKGFLLVWVSGLGIALIDEIIQIFVPGRAFQVIDLMVDGAGVIVGTVLVLSLTFMRKRLVENK